MTQTTRPLTIDAGRHARLSSRSNLLSRVAGIGMFAILLTLAFVTCGVLASEESSGPSYVFSEVGMENLVPYQGGYHIPQGTPYILVPFNITLETNQVARGYFIQENVVATSYDLRGKIEDIKLAYGGTTWGEAQNADHSKVAASSATADQFTGASSRAYLEKLNTSALQPGTYDVGFTIDTAWCNNLDSTTMDDWTRGISSVAFQFIVEGPKDIYFDPNGATAGIMPNQTVIFNDTVSLNKNNFTRAGYDFLQWTTEPDGNGTAYVDEALIHVYHDTTLYAQWVEQGKHSIYGTITNANGHQVNLTLKDTNGNVYSFIVPAGQTSYSLDEIPVGVYDLVAEYTDDNGYTYSVVYLIEVVNEDESVRCDVEFLTKKIETNVEVSTKGDTPNVVVGGLSDEAKAHADEVTDDEYAKLVFEVEAHPAVEIPEDSALIQEIIKTTHPECVRDDILYLNATVSFSIFDAYTQIEKSHDLIHETSTVLEVCIPYNFVNKKAVYVYRSHNGTSEELIALDEKPVKPFVDGTYYLDRTNALVRVYADKYSIYSIAYVKSSSGSHQSGSTIILPNESVTPTPTSGAGKDHEGGNVTATPTPYQYDWGVQTQTPGSPAPFIGLIAGFGVAAALFGLRQRK